MSTALILGGGGPIGIAWEAGLLLGLADRGVNLAQVDRIVGTSAGSIVGAHLALRGSVSELYAAQAKPLSGTIKPPNMAPLMAAFTKAKLLHRSVQGFRRSLGKSALKANVEGEPQWLAAITELLPLPPTSENPEADLGWPDRELLLTAIEVESGELVTWTRDSPVSLLLAVASSCAVPCVFPLVHVHGRTYMDGGMGSPTNAALGTGHDLVIVADPLGRMMGEQSPGIAEQRLLQTQGSRVVNLVFDDAMHSLVGMNLMDARQRERAAALGREQGHAIARTGTLIL